MKLKLIRVRLSFPSLFKPKSVNGSDPKYGASFLLDKKLDAAQIDSLRSACLAVAKEKWPAKIPAGVKYCVHDGAEKDYDGYGPGIMFISASNAMQPGLVDERVQPIMDQRKIYAGCIVNAAIRLWAQDNDFGKRINAQLQGVQFIADGEAFGEKPFDPNEEFQPVADTGEPAAGKPDTSLAGDDIPF